MPRTARRLSAGSAGTPGFSSALIEVARHVWREPRRDTAEVTAGDCVSICICQSFDTGSGRVSLSAWPGRPSRNTARTHVTALCQRLGVNLQRPKQILQGPRRCRSSCTTWQLHFRGTVGRCGKGAHQSQRQHCWHTRARQYLRPSLAEMAHGLPLQVSMSAPPIELAGSSTAGRGSRPPKTCHVSARPPRPLPNASLSSATNFPTAPCCPFSCVFRSHSIQPCCLSAPCGVLGPPRASPDARISVEGGNGTPKTLNVPGTDVSPDALTGLSSVKFQIPQTDFCFFSRR